MRPILIGTLLALLFSSCSSVPRVAPRFVQPSTVPIQKAQSAAVQHVHKAQEIVKTLTISYPKDKAAIDSLSQELDQTQQALAQAEGARDSLDTQLKSQTATANQLADNYDRQGILIQSLQQSRHKYVKLAWLFGGILAAEVLAVAGFFAIKFGLISI